MHQSRQTIRRRNKRRVRRDGAAVVEFAISASVLFLIIMGCVELCRMSMLRNLAQDACYEAARYSMVEGATTDEAWARPTK